MATTSAAIDRARVLELIERERAALLERTPGSQAAFERAVTVMPRGVPSSFQAADPRPTYLSHGEGARVWDVDGNEYVDFHNGFGVMCVGHANPAIVRAVSERAARGSHFAAPTEGSIVVARGAAQALRPAPVALHQLRHRVDDGRRPPRARRDRPRPRPQDRGLLPRPPRRRDGLGAPAARRARRPRGAGQRPVRRRPPARGDRADEGDRVQRRRPARARARRHRRPRRRADPRAGDDEHHDRLPAARLPRARARAVRPPRHRAGLRRGQDRLHDRPRRRDGAVRRSARHRLPGEGDVRRLPRRRDRDDRGPRGADRRRPGPPGRHVQRQPARDGRGARRRCSRSSPTTPTPRFEAKNERLLAGLDDVIARYGLPCHTIGLAAKGCVVFSPEPPLRVPRLRDEGRRGAFDARLAVPHEPRHLHDAGRRRAVDAVGRARGRETCSATSTRSRRSRATSPPEHRADRVAPDRRCGPRYTL